MILWIFFSLLGLTAGASVLFLLRQWRRRRRLDVLGRRHKMRRRSSREVEEILQSLAGRWVQTGLRDVLEGRDAAGRYFAARRGWGREMKEVFIVELSRPTPARGLGLDSLPSGALRLQWELTPDRALDGQAREVVQKVLREFAAFKLHHPRPRISLEVGERGAVLHAPAVGEEQRTAFIAAARVLRGDLMHCLYRRGSTMPGVEAPPGPAKNADAMESRRAGRGPREEGTGDGSDEALHPDIDRALENLEPKPLVSADELVAEKPPPVPKGWQSVHGKAVFEIPEPEEEVVVLEACASRTKATPAVKDLSEEERRALFFVP